MSSAVHHHHYQQQPQQQQAAACCLLTPPAAVSAPFANNGARGLRCPVEVMPAVADVPSRPLHLLSEYTNQPAVTVLANITWRTLPAAVDSALELRDRYLVPRLENREAVLGMTLTCTPGEPGIDRRVFELFAWVSVQDSTSESAINVVFHHMTSDVAHRNGAVVGTFDLRTPSRNDGAHGSVISILVEQNGQRVLAVTQAVTTDGRTVNWAQSNLPERFGLGGGQYELHDVHIHPSLLRSHAS